MLTKETTKKLKKLGFDVEALVNAAKAETEVEYTVPEIATYTDEQLAERDTNTIAAAKPAIFGEGKTAGLEIAGKAIAKKYGLTDVDHKDPNKVIAALDATVAKGDDGLKEQIGLLQADKTRLETTIAEKDGQVKAVKFDSDLIKSFPANRNNAMSDDEYLLLAKNLLTFEEVDGKPVVKRNGEVLRDKATQAPITPKDAIAQVFTEKKWVSAEQGGGRGGDDNTGGNGGSPKKYSTFEAQWLKQNPGKNPISPEFTAALVEAAKDPVFEMNG
jgi:hypothetical protein